MIVLGIDPGSLITGYAFLEQRTPQELICVLEYGAIRAKAGQELMKRLGSICAELEPRIEQYRPGMLAMESSFFSENARTALVLGHARGAVMALAYRFQMEFAEFSPRSIKKAVTGSGAADKERVARMIQVHLKLAELPAPADASDALAAAWTYLTMQHPPMLLPQQKAPRHQGQTHLLPTQPRTSGLVANALPAGTDLTSLLAHARKRKRK